MSELLEQYQDLPEAEKDYVCENLCTEVCVNREGFVCPCTQLNLSVPCGLSNCGCYLENDWARNCVLYYMHSQGVDKLSPAEISFLYRVPLKEVNEIFESQMAKVRDIRFIRTMQDQNKVTYLKNVPICCVCECKVENGIQQGSLTYCSNRCLKSKPPYVIRIERRYESDIQTILEVAFRTFHKLDVIESLFKVSRRRIEFMVMHFADHLSSKFVSLTSSNELLARKERVSKLCERALSRMNKGALQFGSPIKTMKQIADDFLEAAKAA